MGVTNVKLDLTKGWFEKNIPHDSSEVGAGLPGREIELNSVAGKVRLHREDEFVEAYAFGALIQLLRRERNLSVDQLASAVQIATPELISIELDPKHISKPRTVFLLSKYFGLPDRPLMKLANVTKVHSDKLRDAAVRFAASSSKVMELSREERAALAEFMEFLASQETV